MSDLIRSSVEINDEKIIKYQVQDNTNNDKLIRHQVMGIGGGSAPVLESLNVTENGTYTPGEGVDGFNNVNVNVSGSIPDEWFLISEFDFATAGDSDLRRYDKARNYSISTQCYTGVISGTDYIEFNANNSKWNPQLGWSVGQEYKVEIDIKECAAPQAKEHNVLICDLPDTKHGLSFHVTNTSTLEGEWQLILNSDVNLGITNYDYFDNKTITLYFGRYNGGISSQWYIMINDVAYPLDVNTNLNLLMLGSATGSNSYNGAKFKGFRVYCKFKNYGGN